MQGNLDPGLNLVLEKVTLLKSLDAKKEVYKALFTNKTISIGSLLNSQIVSNKKINVELLEHLLNHDACMQIMRDGITNKLPQKITDQVVLWIQQKKVNANIACHLFHTNQDIILAAYKMNPESLQYANNRLIERLQSEGKVTSFDALRSIQNPNAAQPVIATLPVINDESTPHKKVEDIGRLLIEIGEVGVADKYYNGTLDLSAIKKECEAYIPKIEQAAVGDRDEFITEYIKLMNNVLETENNVVTLVLVLKELKNVEQAVNSPEMKAIRTQLERLEFIKKIGIGSAGVKEKIDTIKQTLREAPLLERATVFSDEQSPISNKLKHALAANRYQFLHQQHKENDKVDPKNAAKSFTLIAKELTKNAEKNSGSWSSMFTMLVAVFKKLFGLVEPSENQHKAQKPKY
jgi:hypothetical protein